MEKDLNDLKTRLYDLENKFSLMEKELRRAQKKQDIPGAEIIKKLCFLVILASLAVIGFILAAGFVTEFLDGF